MFSDILRTLSSHFETNFITQMIMWVHGYMYNVCIDKVTLSY